MPDTVACFKWKPRQQYRSTFGPDTVNTLFRMVDRHFPHPYRKVCVTDDPKGLDRSIEVVPIWKDFSEIQSPHGGRNPSCYRRLKVFGKQAGEMFGNRFVCLDLDTVVVGDLTPLWDRPEDFVIWGETNPRSYYNGSMFLLTAGTRQQVLDRFDPTRSPLEAKAAGKFGSDQGWISYCLGPGEATWKTSDGVYSYNVHLRHNGGKLPDNARIVMFHGGVDPWSNAGKALPWVQEHYN